MCQFDTVFKTLYLHEDITKKSAQGLKWKLTLCPFKWVLSGSGWAAVASWHQCQRTSVFHHLVMVSIPKILTTMKIKQSTMIGIMSSATEYVHTGSKRSVTYYCVCCFDTVRCSRVPKVSWSLNQVIYSVFHVWYNVFSTRMCPYWFIKFSFIMHIPLLCLLDVLEFPNCPGVKIKWSIGSITVGTMSSAMKYVQTGLQNSDT